MSKLPPVYFAVASACWNAPLPASVGAYGCLAIQRQAAKDLGTGETCITTALCLWEGVLQAISHVPKNLISAVKIIGSTKVRWWCSVCLGQRGGVTGWYALVGGGVCRMLS